MFFSKINLSSKSKYSNKMISNYTLDNFGLKDQVCILCMNTSEKELCMNCRSNLISLYYMVSEKLNSLNHDYHQFEEVCRSCANF